MLGLGSPRPPGRAAGGRRYLVSYTVIGSGKVEVVAASEEEAREMVGTGKVELDPDDFELFSVESVDALGGEEERGEEGTGEDGPVLPAFLPDQLRLFEPGALLER